MGPDVCDRPLRLDTRRTAPLTQLIGVLPRSRHRSEERDELKRLRKENFELRRANAILKDASVYFAQELDPTRRR